MATSSYPPIPTAEDLSKLATSASSSNWAKFYAVSENMFGITKFNQAVPMIISAVAVGTSVVNRNFPKCIGHLGGAMLVGLLMSSYGVFTTAFLTYTIAYVSLCMSRSKSIDSNSLISIIMGFIILVFINLVTIIGGIGVSVRDYIFGILAGIAFGIGGFYLTMNLSNSAALYDFSGCSCDDCDAKSKCAIGSKTRTVMAKKLNDMSSN